MVADYQKQKAISGLYGGNASYIEALYEDFLVDENLVDENWRKFFREIKQNSNDQSRLDVQERFYELAKRPFFAETIGADVDISKQLGVINLIRDFRNYAHYGAQIDPINLRDKKAVPTDNLADYGLNKSDFDTVFQVFGAFGQKEMALGLLIDKLQKTYSQHLGLEVAHLWDESERNFFISEFEQKSGDFGFSAEDKKRFLQSLIAADGMEKYLHKKYVGQKRFSLEGGDALIPLTKAIIEQLANLGSEEIGIAMAHRGRLNMLINVFGKKSQALFDEFEGKFEPRENRSGDVKYHMGFSSQLKIQDKTIDISLAYNPSHLEFVNAVQMGSTRARLERLRFAKEKEEGGSVNIKQVAKKASAIMIHGDAALAGQGVNQEILQLSQLRNYEIGGAIHIVVNNQVGFTTSNPLDARSSMYCTDIAKSVQVPIIHANGDDPEAVVFAGILAAKFVKTFNKDIFIDLVCYRRLGHNEADEPSATQPKMYQKIRNHPVPAKIYAEKLLQQKVINQNDYDDWVAQYLAKLANGERLADSNDLPDTDLLKQSWQKLSQVDWQKAVKTDFDINLLKELGQKAFTIPPEFNPHKIVGKLYETRLEMVDDKKPLDWGAAENLAYATLLSEGYLVRISGEDCGRGTFSHRHCALHDQQTGKTYYPLNNIAKTKASFSVIDSLLSETGVLGFEYGYSTAEPNGLVIWEAQFGDFANVAQVIIDQFIASGETKWDRYSGLTMLLPHGYEGQGPEHSSARLERYLQLCADDNIQVCAPTTPSQIYHLLRRQVLRDFRKPLIVMSPKSLLRHKLAVSTMQELADGQFFEVIDEVDQLNEVSKVILCSGKVYYDLLEQRRSQGIDNVAIIRIEQLYPFPEKAIKTILQKYPESAQICWCQEEPRNQGAWLQIYESLRDVCGRDIEYVGRKQSASTAVGFAKVHNLEQQQLVEQALYLKK